MVWAVVGSSFFVPVDEVANEEVCVLNAIFTPLSPLPYISTRNSRRQGESQENPHLAHLSSILNSLSTTKTTDHRPHHLHHDGSSSHRTPPNQAHLISQPRVSPHGRSSGNFSSAGNDRASTV
eukprot:scaffold10321_cov69-Cyclotella_meneghiniana.AAC.7